MSLLNLFGDDADFFTGKTPESRARVAGQIAYESIPLISEAVTFRDIKTYINYSRVLPIVFRHFRYIYHNNRPTKYLKGNDSQ